MHGKDNGLLDQAITAANDWRNQAASVGVGLNQLNFQFPDARPVVFTWDTEKSDWLIDT
jgi:hypothetical protein